MYFTVHWEITCSKGDGGCSGLVTISAPHKTAAWTTNYPNEPHARIAHINCFGVCPGLHDGSQTLKLEAHGLGVHQRPLEVAPIVISRLCQGKALPPIRLSIAFDGDGDVDVARSKLH